MKCKHAQRCLLSTSGPRKLADDVLAHLDTCPACKAWQVRLQEIDRSVPNFTVPDSSEAKAAVIEQILADPAVITPNRKWWQLGTVWQRAAVAVAASALVILVGSRAFRGTPVHGETATVDPILSQLLDRNLTFAKAPTEQKKIETLAAMAQDLETETSNLARVASAEELNTLADLYEDVIRKGLLVQLELLTIPPDDRAKALGPIADQFFASSNSVGRLAKNAPPAAAPALNKIAALADKANQELRNKTHVAGAGKDEKLAHDKPSPSREGQS